MEPLAIVAFLVTCSNDYLHCRTFDTEGLSWRDPRACNSDVSRMIREHEREGYPNVMGKCRIVIPDEKYRTYPIG